MGLDIVPLAPEHLDAAAALLAGEQRRRRVLEPILPLAYEAAEQARQPIEEGLNLPGARGVMALRDGAAAGFLLAVPRNPGRIMSIPFHGNALAPSEPHETYRELYAVLADDWVRRGYFRHSLTVLDADRPLRDCWDSLGFGRLLTMAVRDVVEPVADAPELDIRQLGGDKIDVIAQLEEANARHHNTSPIFVPYFPEDRDAYRTQTEALLQDPANAHFVAYEGGSPAGMNTFLTDPHHSPLLQPEKDVYLFQGIVYEQYRHAGIGRGLLAHSMRWARDRGYSTCSLHYFAPNLVGSRFWTANGFRPLMHIVSRGVDQNVAWGRPEIQQGSWT